jgi:exonuclease SbcC
MRAAELTQSIAEIDRQLIEAAAEFDSVDDRLAAMEAIREDITALASARAALGEATRAQAQAQAVLDALDEPIVEDGLEADGVLEAQLIEARSVATAAIVSAEAARTLLDDIGRLSTGVENARSERDRTRQEWAATISLAETLNGRGANQLAQPLKAYVLQQMFDEVLDAANARLSGMLEGRFALVDTEQAQGRERIKGLGIEIMDRFTDSVRRADTLSGGETFCAALALALGLADTVRAHAGGIDIGMLFVDEGFGSLDPDRLDDVMAELMRLRADGRTVGVISHVSEMKRSILERISVRSVGPGAGSTLTVTWMAE